MSRKRKPFKGKIDGQTEHDFVSHIHAMMLRAGEFRLFKTMHALHEAGRVAGFEFAEHLTKPPVSVCEIPRKMRGK